MRSLKLLLVLVLLAPFAWSTTYWVATTGLDTNAGTLTAPFLTPEKAATMVTAGDTAILRDGTYSISCANTGLNQVDLVTAGTATSPITFRAEHYRQAILTSANSCAYAIKVHIGADFNIIDGLVITQHLTGGIQAQGNNDTYIRNEIHHIGNVSDTSTGGGHVGIVTYQGSDATLIDSNYLHDIGRTNTGCPATACTARDQNLYVEGTNNTLINNVIRLGTVGAGGFGMSLKVGSSYIVSNNTFYGGVPNGEHGQIVIGDDLHTPLSNFTIQNNIFAVPVGAGVTTCGVALSGTNTIDHNITYGSGVTGVFGGDICSASTGLGTIAQSSNSIADPLFTNAGSFDFHIPSNSPAVDAGVTVSQVSLDYDGVPKGQSTAPDLGAFDFAALRITSPTAYQAVRGFSGFPFTAALTSAPSTSRVCYVVNDYPEGCSTLAPWSLPYNTFNHLNGNHRVVATAYDSLGNVLATSAARSFSTANTSPASYAPGLDVSASTPFTSAWAGVVNVTGTVSGSGTNSLSMTLWVDGDSIISVSTTAGTATIPLDTSAFSNNPHLLAWTVTDNTGGATYDCTALGLGSPTVGLAAEWSRVLTFSNGSLVNSLQVNSHEVFIVGTGTKTITAKLLNADGSTTTPGSLLFYSQNAPVATVGQTSGIITGVTNGNAQIRAVAPLTSGTDLKCLGSCSNATYSSVSHFFTNKEIGNVLRITAGTGFTTGFYEISFVSPNGSIGLNSCITGSCGGSPGGIIGNPATWTEGPSRTVWAFVNDQNILAHFGSDGSILTAYDPAKSFIPHSIFSSNLCIGDTPYRPGCIADIAASGYNTFETAITNQDMSGAAGQTAFQNGQTAYVAAQEALFTAYPNLRYFLIGDTFWRADAIFNTTRSVSASWTPPAVQTIFQSWTGQANPPIEAPMGDEIQTQLGFKPLQGPITFTGSSIQSGLTSIVASGGACTVNWANYSLNAANSFIITGSVTTGMNSSPGTTYGASNQVTGVSFTFSCPSVANGTYNSGNDSLLMIEPYASSWKAGNTDYIHYDSLALLTSWANAVPGHVARTWANSAATNNTSIANWEGNGHGTYGSGQSLNGVSEMSETAELYWSNLNSYLARRVTAQSVMTNVGDVTRKKYGAYDPGKPMVLETAGTPTNYGFTPSTVPVTSMVNGLITFAAPHGLLNIIPGVTRLSIAGATGLNTDYYVLSCPDTTSCNVYYSVTQFGTAATHATGTGCTITFQNGDTKSGVDITATGQNAPTGVIGGLIMGDIWIYSGPIDPNVARHRGQTFTLSCTGGTAQATFNSTTFLYPFDNVTNYNQQTFRQPVIGSATGGTATIVADNLYVRGRNANLGYDYNPGATFATVIEALILGAAGQRAYQYGEPPQAFSDTTGFTGANISGWLGKFSDTCNATVQSSMAPHYENDLVVPVFKANSMASRLWTRIQKYALQPRLDTPDYGSNFEATARSGSAGTMLLALNVSDASQTQTFTLTPYLQSGQQIVRFYANYQSIQLVTLAAGTSTDTLTMDPEATVVYLFPATFASELQQPAFSARLADVPNATKIVVRYAYDLYWLDQLSPVVDCGTGTCTFPADRNIGPIFYRLIYLDGNSRILATSDVQTL